ncbi:MAG: golvesin C-terminal-like domain-containing protein [Armatimonadota bacterium]
MATAKNWFMAWFIAGLLIAQGAVWADDFPMFRLNPQRTGATNLSTEPGPGRAYLRWWWPAQQDRGITLEIDRDGLNRAGDYTVTQGSVTTINITDTNAITDGFRDSYDYATAVNPSQADDPTSGATVTVRWRNATPNELDPNDPAYNPLVAKPTRYQIAVWFPSSGTAGNRNVREAVYKVRYPTGTNTYGEVILVVDQTAGGRWVRLGSAGSTAYIFNTTNNTWERTRLRSDLTFPFDGRRPVEVYAYNTSTHTDEDGNFDDAGRLVVFDGVRFMPDLGAFYSSPVAATVQIAPGQLVQRVFIGRIERVPDVNDPTASVEIGVMYAFDNAGRVAWRYPLNVTGQRAVTVDDADGPPTFQADLGWIAPVTPQPDPYGTSYLQTVVTNIADPALWLRVRWQPDLQPSNGAATAQYTIYVWLPQDDGTVNRTTVARYIVHHDEGDTVVEVDQTQNTAGGQWFSLGTYKMRQGTTNYVELVNYTRKASEVTEGRVVIADAVRFVEQGTGASGIFSTPVVQTVPMRLPGGSVADRQLVFFTANDGRVYALDAVGNGDGTTFSYWIYPEEPLNERPVLGSFGYSSPLVVNIATSGSPDWRVYVANSNGRVYCLDASGNGDFSTSNPGTTDRVWIYPAVDKPAIVDGFVSSPAYNRTAGVGPTVFVGGLDGRLYALDAEGSGGTTTERWIYPGKYEPASGNDPALNEELPLDPISTTPAIFDGKVYFASADGRVYCVREDGIGRRRTERVWVWPYAANPPLNTAGDENPVEPFQYSSPTVAPQVNTITGMRDVVFIGDRGGTVYALDAQGTGNGRTDLVWQDVTDPLNPVASASGSMGAPIYSSITFTQIIPSRSATGTGPLPAVVFGLMDGKVLALNAFNSGPGTFRQVLDNNGNLINVRGDVLWGWQTLGQSVFASPAVANDWMYIAGDDGIIYAFSPTGGYLTPGEPPGAEIVDTALSPELTNLKVEVFTAEEYADIVQRRTRTPEEVVAGGHTRKIGYEWGDTVYVIAYGMQGLVPPARSVTLTLRSRAATVNRTVGVVPYGTDVGVNQKWMAYHAFRIVPTQDGDAWTPGARYTATVRATSTTTSAGGQPTTTMTFERTPDPYFEFTIAHPLALRILNPDGTINPDPTFEVGWIGQTIVGSSVPQELSMNGNAGKNLAWMVMGLVPHGASGSRLVQIADRSKVALLGGDPLRVKVQRANLAWHNNDDGSLAVINPLPWDDLPVNIPNTSVDYPNIPERVVRVSAGGVDLYSASRGGALAPPTDPVGVAPDWTSWTLVPTTSEVMIQVPRFQPANLVGFDGTNPLTARGYATLFRRPIRIYVDVNNNGQLDLPGGPGLRQTPPVTREEPYREFRVTLGIPPDMRLRVEEETVDIGAVPHGFGVHPDPATHAFRPPISDSDPAYLGDPWYQALKPFWKPFTVRSLSNVNLLNVRAVGSVDYLDAGGNPVFQNPLPVTLMSDQVSPYYWEVSPAGDPTFTFHKPALTAGWVRRADGSVVQQNVFTSIDQVYDPMWLTMRPPLYNGFPGMHTLHKPRPDSSPTVLSIPDKPYPGAAGGAFDNVPTTKPLVSVQVPLGTPAGTYSNLIRIFEAASWNPYVLGILANNEPAQPVSEPTMRVKVTVTESRLTNSTSSGSLPQIDMVWQGIPPQPGQPGYLAANVQPAALMGADSMLLAWSSNWSRNRLVEDGTDSYRETQPSGSNAWFLHVAVLPRDAQRGVWVPASSIQWWSGRGVEYPRDPTNSAVRDKYGRLFTTLPGTVIPSSIKHYAPTFFVVGNQPYLLWQGQVAKRQTDGSILTENVTFVAPVVNGVPGTPVALGNDAALPRFQPRVTVIGGVPVMFWYSGASGRYAIYYNACLGSPLNPSAWTRDQQLPMPAVVTNAFEPLAIPRPGLGVIDVVCAASTKTRQTNEILLTRFRLGGGGRLTPVNLPPVRGEVLQRIGTTNVWMSRDLSWMRNLRIRIWRVGDPHPLAANDIQQSGNPVVYWYNQQFDSNTGILYLTRYTDSARTQIDWQVAIDLSAGTVTFPYRAPARSDVIFADYTPRAMRVTANHGWNSLVPNDGVPVPQPIAFYGGANSAPTGGMEKSQNPRWKYILPALNNPTQSPPVDRLGLFYRKSTGSTPAEVFVAKTMRLGVQLPTPVYAPVITDGQGERRPDVSGVTVNGISAPIGPVEVDFVRGRLYFTDADEGKLVSITYVGLDAQGNPEPSPRTVVGVVRWIDEMSEATEGSQAIVPLVGATSESNLFALKDEFEPKVWLFWSSTRGGSSDLFFEAFSPRLFLDVVVP